MLTLRKFSVVMFLFLFLNSCEKETIKSKTNLLTQKSWVGQKLEIKEGTSPWVDEFPNLSSCTKDDRYIFNKNNTYEFNEGPTKCDPSNPQVFESGSWLFTNNETKLQLGSDEYTIEFLNEDIMVLSVQETNQGIVIQTRFTFRHP